MDELLQSLINNIESAYESKDQYGIVLNLKYNINVIVIVHPFISNMRIHRTTLKKSQWFLEIPERSQPEFENWLRIIVK